MMNITEGIKKYRHVITMVLALAGIGLMLYYDYCDQACSYLKGDVWGIDLKWIGIAYMLTIVVLAAFKQQPFVRALLAAGLGVEVHLHAFQLHNAVYCPFCLGFSAMVIASFIINYEVPSAWRGNRRRMWLYFLGEVDFPMLKIKRLPLLAVGVLGYVIILLTFSGSVTPAYGKVSTYGVPSLGKGPGPYEVILFADYFCSPCRQIDSEAEPLLKELLATSHVKITFVDVPVSRATPTYAKYYLYAANADADAANIFHVRRALFEAAQVKRIQTEGALVAYLKEQKIAWKVLDEKSIFPQLNAMINEHKVEFTPTCVIKYSAQDVEKYIGIEEIWDGLTAFKAHLEAMKN